MWKTLHQLANPPRLYQICGYFIPWLAIASALVLAVGWIWGFGFAPAACSASESEPCFVKQEKEILLRFLRGRISFYLYWGL